MKQIALINGTNLNLLGNRAPQYYGTTELKEIERKFVEKGRKDGYDIICFQSNSEEKIINFIQKFGNQLDGVVINPAGFSTYSYGIIDAIEAFEIPYIEIHLSNIYSRGKRHSKTVFAKTALGIVSGFKEKGYEMALDGLIWHLEMSRLKGEQ